MLNPRTRIPPAVANAQRNSALIFIAYNVFNGLAHQGIDNAAHLGGLVSGFALGWVLAVPVGTRPATIDRTLMMATVAALAVLGGAFTLLQHPGAEELERRHLVAALQPFFDAEGKAVDLMSKLADELKAGQITNQAAAARIQVEVKPLWENALATVSAATSQATGARREAADAVQRYCEARLRHAGLTADALRQEQAELNSRAAEAAQQVNGLADKAREALKVLNP
jgi:rhomboid protease GluP